MQGAPELEHAKAEMKETAKTWFEFQKSLRFGIQGIIILDLLHTVAQRNPNCDVTI
jgi:hypothetical protein